jgi:hypothetical protein
MAEGQVPSNPQVFNQGITGVPADYTIDRKSVFVMKIVFAAIIFSVFVPCTLIHPAMFPNSV